MRWWRYLGLVLVLSSSSCSSLLYQPYPKLVFDPKLAGIIYETVSFKTSDGLTLKGWFFPAQQVTPPLSEGFFDDSTSVKSASARGTVIHFHGNGENRSTHFGTLVWLVEHGYNLFTFDYRGYADSEGKAEPAGVYQDGVAAIQWVKERAPRGTDAKDLIFYGQSLGGAIIARCFESLEDRTRARALVIESSFDSYKAIAADVLSRSWLTWLFQPLGYVLISDETSPQESFAKISPTPLLVIHGRYDEVVPYKFGEKIFSLAHEPKTFIEIPRGRHLNTYAVEKGRYQAELVKYLNELPGAKPAPQKEYPSSSLKRTKRGK